MNRVEMSEGQAWFKAHAYRRRTKPGADWVYSFDSPAMAEYQWLRGWVQRHASGSWKDQ